MAITTGIVLAAGEGTRLRPLTVNRPKTMLPAADRPILEHVLDVLVECGIERLCLVVGYRRERVQEYFGHSYRGVPITYVHQRKQLGSAHALGTAADAVEGPVLVLNGDRVIEERIVGDVLDGFDGDPTLAVLEHLTPSEYGAVRIEGERLTEFVEKPNSDDFRLINAGVYAFDSSVFDAIDRTPRHEGELTLPDVIEALMHDGTVHAVTTDGLWVDATYPWDLLYLMRELLSRGLVSQPKVDAQVWVAESARVHPDATLQGPVVVGPDSEIGAGAVLGPNVAVGRNATVGANATLRDVLLDGDCRIEAGATLLDCVAGETATVGAGTVVPGGPGDVRVGDTVFENQRLGAVLADRVSVGGGVTFSPGTLVGAGVDIAPGVYATGTIADGTEVVR
ncbi:MAG: sugar phosphate nucleotidyltransferase [Natronomonas sp.]|uniref:sugar phosphate nucleotidyltransferase n=1 Tax=Natronomonas sp. TaxID=2184060 RepID=UPI00286FB6F3|nr:sugar phosphate nucleotidyltransferase [Natronomonas sp.]MDR9382277.1 sugar phosphate nucleotidyltransferase [Natronomonas sp.]MDR9430004.1 sugar phosphate nucleotidyltransferase [Natronomonas sp.]